ncbi:MAG: dienelactone hydrolase family protein [Verrucomicrobiales bacterium]
MMSIDHFPKSLFRSLLVPMAVTVFFPATLLADDPAVTTDEVIYGDDAAPLNGYFAAPADLKADEMRPGILVIHDWTGLQEYAKERTRQLAELGFIAFAADVYGKGVRPANPQECGVQAGIYKSDRTLFRKRLNAALDVLKKHKHCDSENLAAIGYCFGGTGVIELARSGADVKGIVSFHGGLDSPKPEDGKNIKAKVLICHGADDPYVPEESIDAFVKEMNDAGVDWQMISYSGAVHSFTKPDAGDDNSKGAAYNKNADKRSWEHMRTFFKEVLGR